MWKLLQVSNMCNNDWLSELHNGQISLSFMPARNKLDFFWQDMLWIILMEDYKLWFLQDSERKHIDVFDVFCGEAVV